MTKPQQASVDVLEGNKIIAEFMGGNVMSTHTAANGKDYSSSGPVESVKDWSKAFLKYHSSWDWLMPVVEKISKMPLLNADNTLCTDPVDTCFPVTFNMPTEDGKVMFRFKGFSLHTAEKLIDAAWQAVVEVLEYEITNTQTKKQ